MKKELIREDAEKVQKLLKSVLNADNYTQIERLEGMTNHTYKVTVTDGKEYVVRIPGEGTEKMINRKNEKINTKLACSIGIDAELLYFGEDGSKLSAFIHNAVTMTPILMKEEKYIKQVAEILKRLHFSGVDTKVPFEVFDMAANYESILHDNGVNLYEDYQKVKAEVMQIKAEVDEIQIIVKVPCHNDPLCENWVLGDDKMYLIDWEYAGMNDGMWDLADISIEAGYDNEQDKMLLNEYFNRKLNDSDRKRFIANKIYLDYLWTLWGKTRIPFDGEPMEKYAADRYIRLKENIIAFKKIREGLLC